MKREGSKTGAAHGRPDNANPAGPCQLYNSELQGLAESSLVKPHRPLPNECTQLLQRSCKQKHQCRLPTKLR